MKSFWLAVQGWFGHRRDPQPQEDPVQAAKAVLCRVRDSQVLIQTAGEMLTTAEGIISARAGEAGEEAKRLEALARAVKDDAAVLGARGNKVRSAIAALS